MPKAGAKCVRRGGKQIKAKSQGKKRTKEGDVEVSDCGSVQSECGLASGIPSCPGLASVSQPSSDGVSSILVAESASGDARCDRKSKRVKLASLHEGVEPQISDRAWAKAKEIVAHLTSTIKPCKVVMEIYAGCARFSGACLARGLNIFVPIDRHGNSKPWADTDREDVQAVILHLIDAGFVWYVHLATECKMFSRARTTSATVLPCGVVWFTLKVLRHAHVAKVYVSIENPFPSPLFDWQPLQHQLDLMECQQIRYDCCAYGATFKKSSQIRTNMPSLQELRSLCQDTAHSVLLFVRVLHVTRHIPFPSACPYQFGDCIQCYVQALLMLLVFAVDRDAVFRVVATVVLVGSPPSLLACLVVALVVLALLVIVVLILLSLSILSFLFGSSSLLAQL